MKLQIILVGILLVAFVSSAEAQFTDGTIILRGDVNNDSSVNSSDPIYLLAFLYQGGNSPPCMDAADVNDDGYVDGSDVIYLNNFLYLGGPAPYSPYPYCGHDPSSDSLTCSNSACH